MDGNELAQTGIHGLDAVLRGGLPVNRLYLVQGEPGTGKTTLALQFLLAGRDSGERAMYISLSETRDELATVAASHHWDLRDLMVLDLSILQERLDLEADNTLFHLHEVELNQMTSLLCEEIEQHKPARLVFDSLSEMRLLAEAPHRFRRQILLLKQFLVARNITVLFLDDLTADRKDGIHSLVNGVVTLERELPSFGIERRWLAITKLRGVNFHGGRHDSVLKTGGLVVYPRLNAASQDIKPQPLKSVSTGVPNLDLLLGGGLDRGTSTLLLGPAGTGKSTIALQCVRAMAARGERAAIYAFEEGLTTILHRSRSVGADISEYIASGAVHLHKVDPAGMSPGEFASSVCRHVQEDGVRAVVIDSLNGYMLAMSQEHHLMLQLHDLLGYLNELSAVTIMVLAQQGLTGPMHAPADLTYLSDTVIVTRYFEALGAVKKAVSVIKKRTGPHEDTIRELQIKGDGISVGPPLTQFRGVLTGVPTYTGTNTAILSD